MGGDAVTAPLEAQLCGREAASITDFLAREAVSGT